MRYDAEQKARTRALVVREAARAVRGEGVHNVGVAGIMARAGLTHGGFYAHFASKEALLSEAVGKALDDGSKLLRRVSREASPRQVIARYIDHYLSLEHRDTRERGCPLAALAGDLPRGKRGNGPPDELRQIFAGGLTRLTATLAMSLDEAGYLDTGPLAASILSEMVGALSLSRAVPDEEQSGEILACSRRALKQRLALDEPEPGAVVKFEAESGEVDA